MSRIIFIIVQVALLAGSVLMAGSLFQKQRDMADLQQMPSSTDAAEAGEQDADKTPKPYAAYQAISRRDLFQTPKDKVASPAEIDLAALKPTELKLKLWGTITGEDGLTRAVIEDQTKKEQAFFRAGEEVASAQIKLILREKVVLSVNGEDEILEIEQPAGRGGPPMVAQAALARSNVRPVASPRPAAPQAPAAPRTIRMKLDRLGPISEDPEDWGKDATAAPFVSDEGDGGLMINRITPSSPLRRLGIRNGDVVVGINDQPVAELSDIFETLLDVSEGETLSLNLKRRGRERQIDFQFE